MEAFEVPLKLTAGKGMGIVADRPWQWRPRISCAHTHVSAVVAMIERLATGAA